MAKFDVFAAMSSRVPTFVGSLITNTMCHLADALRKEGEKFDLLKVFNIEKDEEGKLFVDVRVTVNGIEVPFESFVKGLQEDFERSAIARAQVILKERLRDFNDKLYHLERVIESEAKSKFPEIDEDTWKCG